MLPAASLFVGIPSAMLTSRHGPEEFAGAGGRRPRTLALEQRAQLRKAGHGLQGHGPRWQLRRECSWSGQRTRGLGAPTGRPASWAQDLCGHTDPTPRRICARFSALLLPSSNSYKVFKHRIPHFFHTSPCKLCSQFCSCDRKQSPS